MTVEQLLQLKGRVAIVTGGARGIGRATATRLAQVGAIVVIADVDGEDADAAASEISDEVSAPVYAQEVDITDPAAVHALAESTVRDRGGLDVWVNCAAIFASHKFTEIDDEMWERVISVDLDGSFYCVREAARQMVAADKPGVIVQVTSLSAHKGRAARAHYIAAKHGVHGLTRSAAVELAPHGIRVLSVAPSATATRALDLDQQNVGGEPIDAALHQEVLDRARAAIPMERLGEPDDIASVILFAASDLARFMTGSTLYADGGSSAI
jgi:NAD(P)-dependent dehydrogenase (short-subunit alcohol dehydrogenase family)